MRRLILALMAVLLLYLGTYAVLRTAWTEMSEDGRPHVIYPNNHAWIYYLFRPMAYFDEALTGRGSHIGPLWDGAFP